MGGFVSDVLGGIGDAIGGVVNGISDALAGVDDFVHDVIPGGWLGIGAGALMAVGIFDPALLGMAEEGTLTSEAIANAGLDAATVATDVAAVSPEVAAATSSAVASGLDPALIAAANATADPIAALNAAAGWTTADTAYLATIGASPELIAAAEANNATLAAGGTPTAGAVEGPVAPDTSVGTTGAGGTTATETPGAVAPDTSVGTTGAGGTTGVGPNTPGYVDPTTGQTLVSPADATHAAVWDAGPGVPGLNNTLGAAEPTLMQGIKDLGSAGLEALGLGGMSATQIATMAAAGLLAPSVLSALGLGGGAKAIGSSNNTGSYVPTVAPTQPALAQPGVNPGFMPTQPYYATTNDVQSKYTWNQHPYMQTPADFAHFNEVPGATAQPWGIQHGPEPFDVNTFIKNTINPAYTAAAAGSAPGTYRPPAYAAATPGVVTGTPVAPVAPTAVPH
jgi:hypothetical protein